MSIPIYAFELYLLYLRTEDTAHWCHPTLPIPPLAVPHWLLGLCHVGSICITEVASMADKGFFLPPEE